MSVVQLMFVCLFFHQVTSSGRHSVWALASYISGTTPFPEFSVVLMLDDIQVGYYDSEMDQPVRVGGGSLMEVKLELGQESAFILRTGFIDMKNRLLLIKHHKNLTDAGVHVHQAAVGCEALDDGQLAFFMRKHSVDGQDTHSLMFNATHFTCNSAEGWEWTVMNKLQHQVVYSNIYLPFCTRLLRYMLDQEKRLVMRRVRPRVHFLTKQVVGGARVTCLATDFYPRHINLTLLRDGVPVEGSELTGGSVLPNGNGLYQVRRTLTVGDEELQRKHNYTCETSHLSLDNRLQVSWRAEFSRSHRIYIISAPICLTLAAILLLLLLLWRRRWRKTEGIAIETQEQQEQELVQRQ